MNFNEFLNKIPKIELHLHMEGSIRPNTYIKLAQKYSVQIPTGLVAEQGYRCSDMQTFAQYLMVVFNILRDADDFRLVTYECLQDSNNNGVRYVELFYDPGMFLNNGIPYEVILTGLRNGIRDAEMDFGIVARLIPCLNREAGKAEAEQVVEIVQRHRCDEVIGIGLDFDETNHPAAQYAEAYQLAKQYGLHRTAHAGREGTVENIRDSVELLDCERIDYGYRILEDEALISQCLDKDIVFTVAPTNLSQRFNNIIDPSAIKVMHEHGLKITINTDDPTFLDTNLVNEYRLAVGSFNFNLGDVKRFMMNAIDGAWVDKSTKGQWRQSWGLEFDQLSEKIVQR